MRKTRLALEDLAVDSFDTGSGRAAGGTVHGHQLTPRCGWDPTHYGTCQGTCVDSCGGPTCEYPCQTANTCHLTCQAGCSWTNGYQVCKEP